jgi:hypothetical protein
MKSIVFWDVISSLLKVNYSEGTCNHHLHGHRVSQKKTAWLCMLPSLCCFLALLFFTLHVEVVCYSETSTDFQHTTLCYASEDSTIYDNLVLSNFAVITSSDFFNGIVSLSHVRKALVLFPVWSCGNLLPLTMLWTGRFCLRRTICSMTQNEEHAKYWRSMREEHLEVSNSLTLQLFWSVSRLNHSQNCWN